jgi:hypothetical protein
MDEKQLEKIEELTMEVHMNLEILNHALKQMEMDGIDVCAVSSFVEIIYKKSDKIINNF